MGIRVLRRLPHATIGDRWCSISGFQQISELTATTSTRAIAIAMIGRCGHRHERGRVHVSQHLKGAKVMVEATR